MLQKDIVGLEKEIISKNNKIYALELSAIKKGKEIPGSPSQSHHNLRKNPMERASVSREREIPKPHRSLRTFSIM